MTVQELGSLGEFVGAIAVVATIIYLSIQTRLTRKAAEETARFQGQLAARSVVDLYSHWRSLMANPDLPEVLARAKSSEDLTEKEQILFAAVFEELFWTSAAGYLSNTDEDSAPGESVDIVHLLGVLKENPRAIAEWHRSAELVAMFAPEFVESINKLLTSQSDDMQSN